jgi:hypothetical protein
VLNGFLRLKLSGILLTIFVAASALPSETSAAELTQQQNFDSNPTLIKLRPEGKAGRGYKLIYLIDAPLDVVWGFKTNFDNQFLLSNKYINSHRFVSRNQNEVVTENEYSDKPKLKFKWKTTLFPDQYLLNYVLLNPEECGQKYHHGSIQLEAVGNRTRVTQVAYFNFFGVSFWVGYPFRGGMSHFLKYTAAWEQQTVLDTIGKNEE